MSKCALVLSPLPFRFATRSRKAATVFARTHQTTYISPARVGRNKMWDNSGKWVVEGVNVVQVATVTPRTQPNRRTQVFNLSLSYAPALFLMTIRTLRTRADLVFVNSPFLVSLGLLHKLIYRSELILDINERPGLVATKGSLATFLGKFEPTVLRLVAKFVDIATVVTYADLDIVKDLGFGQVLLVRNVPMDGWKAPYVEPPIARNLTSRELRAIAMGTVYEGRGYETLLEAIAIANLTSKVRLMICGPGRDSYKGDLTDLARSLKIDHMVEFMDPVHSSEVSATYLKADVGMVLYESHDPGNDGLSNKLFECVSTGRPVIASDLPENHRFVETHQVGWLTQTDGGSIAAALVIASDPEILAGLANHCRKFGDERLNWEAEFSPISAMMKPSSTKHLGS